MIVIGNLQIYFSFEEHYMKYTSQFNSLPSIRNQNRMVLILGDEVTLLLGCKEEWSE